VHGEPIAQLRSRSELAEEGRPSTSRVLVLSYLADPIVPLQVRYCKGVAPSLGVTFQIPDIKASNSRCAMPSGDATVV